MECCRFTGKKTLNSSDTTRARKNEIIHRIFPFVTWMRTYRMWDLRHDVIAGFTVSIVLIPQSMAYAMMAGLPPVYGLYTAAVTSVIASLWGSIRQLATGPIAIMSLLVFTTLSPIAAAGSTEYIQLACSLSLLIGLCYLAIGLFRLGIVMSFISHSAVRGFTSAASLIICATQIPHLLGIPQPHQEFIFPMLIDLFQHIRHSHLWTCGIGLLSLVIIYTLKKYKPNWPAGLMGMAVATLLSGVLHLESRGVAVIGQIQGGLPSLQLPVMDVSTISSLIGPIIIIALISFAETYSVGREIAGHTRQQLDVNQEFVGQGLANAVGAFFQCYPAGGSFSRTAINFAAGAQTGASGILCGLMVMLTLLFFTPIFTHVPRASMSALVISAVLILFHPGQIITLWKKNRNDGVVATAVFGFSLITKPDYALIIGVMISLILFLWKTMHPRIVHITRDPATRLFINAETGHGSVCPQILHLRVDNAIFFANAEYTTHYIRQQIDVCKTPIKYLILELQAVPCMDITGIGEMQMLWETLTEKGIKLVLVGIHAPVRTVLNTSGFEQAIGANHFFNHKGEAVAAVFPLLDTDYCQNSCPYVIYDECDRIK